MCNKRSKLLKFLIIVLFFQTVVSIYCINPAATYTLSRIATLSHQFLIFCEEHSVLIHNISKAIKQSFNKESGILAPTGPAKIKTIPTKTLDNTNVSNLDCQKQVDIIKDALAPNSHNLVTLDSAKSFSEEGSKTEATQSISIPADNAVDSDQYLELTKSLTQPVVFDRKTRFKIEADRQAAIVQAEIERELLNRRNNPSSFRTVVGNGPSEQYLLAMPFEQQIDNEIFRELITNPLKAFNYLNYVNDFTKILLKSNSIDPIERVLARLELVKYEIPQGPASYLMQDVVSCVIKGNFDPKTGQLDNFYVSNELVRDIAYFLQEVGNDKSINSLRNVVQNSSDQKCNHLVFNEGHLGINCRKLYKDYKSFNLDKITEHEGWLSTNYTIDGQAIKHRYYSVDSDLVTNCKYNQQLLSDIDKINEFLTQYNYHSAKEFVNNSPGFNLRNWRNGLLNEVFTEYGIVKEFIHDPLLKKLPKDELISLRDDIMIKDGCTDLQRLNAILAFRHEAKNNYIRGYVRNYHPGSSVEVENAIYTLIDPVIKSDGQIDVKARFNLIMKFVKSGNKDLINAFSQNGILHTFNNEFAIKCRNLNTNQADFIDYANEILFYEGYSKNDAPVLAKVLESQKLFLKTFSNKGFVDQTSLANLKSLLSDIVSLSTEQKSVPNQVQNKVEEKQTILSELLQESAENDYSNSASPYETFLLIRMIESELNKQNCNLDDSNKNNLVVKKSKDKVKKPKQEDVKKSNEKEKPKVKDDSKTKVKHPNGVYEDAKYHGKENKGKKNKAPKDGQKALDNSIDFKTKGSNKYQRRLAIEGDEFVVLDEHEKGKFHGHVRPWSEVDEEMKKAFEGSGLVTSKGKVIK